MDHLWECQATNDNRVSACILAHNKEGVTVTKSFANNIERQCEKRVKNQTENKASHRCQERSHVYGAK